MKETCKKIHVHIVSPVKGYAPSECRVRHKRNYDHVRKSCYKVIYDPLGDDGGFVYGAILTNEEIQQMCKAHNRSFALGTVLQDCHNRNYIVSDCEDGEAQVLVKI